MLYTWDMRRRHCYSLLAQAAGLWGALALPAGAQSEMPLITVPLEALQWLMAVASVVLGALGSWGLNIVRGRLKFFIGDQRFDPWLRSLFGLLQGGVWFAALWLAAGNLKGLDPLRSQVALLLGGVADFLVGVWQVPVLTIDKTRFPLGTLLLLLVLAFAVFWASRLSAVVLKRFVLSRFNLTIGSQEAIATVCNYVISAVGYILLLQLAGIDLGSIAILLGVIGLGVGFALQNLARNFISGLVLLIERPVQVGDYIVIDNKDGVVEGVNLRAATLRRFDGSRLIVPNTLLVDQQVLNWSTAENRARLSLEVLVRGSGDPEVVTETLLKIASEERRVLTNPVPEVIFRGWREWGMLFELWAWCGTPKEQLRIKSALYYKIDAELRERGVELAFLEYAQSWQTLPNGTMPIQQPNGRN